MLRPMIRVSSRLYMLSIAVVHRLRTVLSGPGLRPMSAIMVGMIVVIYLRIIDVVRTVVLGLRPSLGLDLFLLLLLLLYILALRKVKALH